jgi:hypothetical protein
VVAQKKIVKRQRWVNLGLAALVAVLGWLVFLKPEAPPGAGLHPLSTLRAAQIDSIDIAPANQPRIALRKRQNAWFITEPFSARADVTRIDSLLGLLTAQSEKRMVTADLARFELDKPLARLTLGQQEFAFGATQPLSNQLYVYTQGAVYLISPVYFIDVAKPPPAFISKQLLADDEIPVAFDFPRFTLTRDNGTWHMTPTAGAPTQDAANAYADEWRHALAASVQPTATLPSGAAVRVTLQSGKTLRVGFTRDGADWLLLREDEHLVYRLNAQAGRNLLTPGFASN